jgi:hypothetical protein
MDGMLRAAKLTMNRQTRLLLVVCLLASSACRAGCRADAIAPTMGARPVSHAASHAPPQPG